MVAELDSEAIGKRTAIKKAKNLAAWAVKKELEVDGYR